MCGEDRNHIGPLLARCNQLCKQRMDADLQKYDVTRAQAHVILYLLRMEPEGEVNQKDLENPAFVAMLATLKKGMVLPVNSLTIKEGEKGMLKRTSGQRDGRCRCLTVTEKGRQMQQEMDRSIRETEALMVRDFTDGERTQFHVLLERIIDNMNRGSEDV